MKKLKRILSSILLLCMIVSMLPPVQKVSAATVVTYELETGAIDPNGEYLIVSGTGATAYALNGKNAPGGATAVTVENGTTIHVFEGQENCLWSFEEVLTDTYYIKNNDCYLTIPEAHQKLGCQADLFDITLISKGGGGYAFRHKFGFWSYYIYFNANQSQFMGTTGSSNVLYLFKKIETTNAYTVTVETKLDGVSQGLSDILGETATLHIGKDGNLQSMNHVAGGTYTAAVEENGIYTVYVQRADAEPEATNYTVTVDGQDAAVEFPYYSVNYMVDGGAFHKEVYPAGSRVTAIIDIPTKENYYFQGWERENGNLLKAGDLIAAFLQQKEELNAKWQPAGNLSFTVRYHEKATEKELHASTVVEGVGNGTEILASQYAANIAGYSYAGAGIKGQYYDKEKNPSIIISSDSSKNVLTIYYTPDPDLHLNKNATLEDNGTYTIQLEMFTHNNPVTTLINQDIPLDIVLVLDQSSSMYNRFDIQNSPYTKLMQAVSHFVDLIADHGRANEIDHRLAIVGYGSDKTTYSAVGSGPVAGDYDDRFTNKTDYTDLAGRWTNTGMFDSNGDFHVYPIKGFNYTQYTGQISVDDEGNPNGTYYVKETHDGVTEYVLLTYHQEYRHMITEHEAFEENLKGTDIFGYVGDQFVELERNPSGMWIYGDKELYSSNEFFTYHEKVWTHRHGLDARTIHASMVGDDMVYTPAAGHGDNVVYTREETIAENPDQSIYKDVLIPVTTGANGSGLVQSSFKTAISKLGAAGETHVNYGMIMANNIFEANALKEDDVRQRVVVVFTDGKPGDSIHFDEPETNAALEIAKDIKDPNNLNAKIYTVGLYSGADTERTKQDQEDFMQALSSYYPDAVTLDDVWTEADYVELYNKNVLLTQAGPYYMKVDGKHYRVGTQSATVGEVGNLKYVTQFGYYDEEIKNDKGEPILQVLFDFDPVEVTLVVGENSILVNGWNNEALKDANDEEIVIYRRIGKGLKKDPDANRYSVAAETPEELEGYFGTIVQELTTKISQETLLKDNTILRDIMGQGLVLTPGSLITVYAQAGVFNPQEKKVDWLDEIHPLDQLEIPKNPADTLYSEKGITVDGEHIPYISVYNLNSENPTDPNGENYHPHTVDISGYRYNQWFMNSSKLEGFRLVATITRVEATDDVAWGRASDTNHAQSGLWLPKDETGYRELLEAFDQPTTAFVERAYVLDYGKQFKLSDWYFDDDTENGRTAEAIHIDCNIETGMNWFDTPHKENAKTCPIKYGNVHIDDGDVYYTPTTTQWGGYDQFYVFGNTWRNTILTQDANRNGNLWNKVIVIPANNIYYEDSFAVGNESNGANEISGFIFTGDWKTDFTGGKPENGGLNVETPEHVENADFGDVHGWTDSLADDLEYSDGSARYTDQMGAKVSFQFTGTGVDVYTRTNDTTGIVLAILTPVDVEANAKVQSIAMDNLAKSGDYYQIPTLSFCDLAYGTYQVELIVTRASDVATGSLRYRYYLDGIRVYNPLGADMSEAPHDVKDSYGKELNAVFTEIRDIMITNDDFTPEFNDTGVTGSVFIDWIQPGQESGSDGAGTGEPTYEVGTTFKTYGPKNEVYLSKGQAVVMKVDPKNTYYVGMKSIDPGNPVTVNISGRDLKKTKTITVSHTTDMYYEVTPVDGYLVIQNGSTGEGALLALTKLRTTNMHEAPADNGVLPVQKEPAVMMMRAFSRRLAEQPEEPEIETPEAPQLPEAQEPEGPSVAEQLLEKNKKLTVQLFTAVRIWLEIG